MSTGGKSSTLRARTPGAGILREGQPSRSALMVATLRAAHQLLDAPRLFDDPLALPILGSEQEALVRADPSRFDFGMERVVRTAMAIRSRLAEDELARAQAQGVAQYVVLGAGLDTFAYRQSAAALRVFEVDHPATQAWKRGLLQQAGIALPTSLTFVPFDFERGALAGALDVAGCRLDRPSFFSWLGVTLYLSGDAIFDTLAFVAGLPAGSGIVFDYGVVPELLNPLERLGMGCFAQKCAAEGEPWKSFFAPGVLISELRSLGFETISDFGADELYGRYLAGRGGRLRLGGGTRLMVARV